MKQNNTQKGFVGIIVIIIIALVVLKYYLNIDIKDIVQNKVVQDLWSLIKQIGALLWQVIVIILDFLRVIFDKIKGLIS